MQRAQIQARQAEANASLAESVTANEFRLLKRPILLVEDNPDDQALTLRAIKRNNIANDVIVVEDGKEALDFFFGPGGCAINIKNDLPAVILLDIKLPKIDGIEVLRRIRADERTSSIPVVVLTSSNEDTDLVNSYKLGCNSYIRKPVDFNQFVDAARQLGLYWLMLNEPPPDTLQR